MLLLSLVMLMHITQCKSHNIGNWILNDEIKNNITHIKRHQIYIYDKYNKETMKYLDIKGTQ